MEADEELDEEGHRKFISGGKKGGGENLEERTLLQSV